MKKNKIIILTCPVIIFVNCQTIEIMASVDKNHLAAIECFAYSTVLF